MPNHEVNLDALIPREDFEADDKEMATTSGNRHTIAASELTEGAFFYERLRKPDFQRETASWRPEKVADLVNCFLAEDLIPAVILWKSKSHIFFVIDGAHRLGAIIAWVHDDYGDGAISNKFYDGVIPPEQREAAEKTRKIINKQVGSYRDHKDAITNPAASPEIRARANKLGDLAIQLQWVTGDATKAEDSFFRINQKAAIIDKTELLILRSRDKPNAIAARVIVRAATGHKYWRNFAAEYQEPVEGLGKDIYETLFKPALKTPVKTLEIPAAGRGYGPLALPIVFDFVNIANGIKVVDASRSKIIARDSDSKNIDLDGSKTIEYLKTTKKIAQRISGNHPSSLGLHPAVYFFSATGRFQPTSFLAVVSLIQDMDRKDHFSSFTKVRRKFEDFLISHKDFANIVTTRFGSGVKGFDKLKQLLQLIIDEFLIGRSDCEIIESIKSNKIFRLWSLQVKTRPPMITPGLTSTAKQSHQYFYEKHYAIQYAARFAKA